MLTYNSLAMYRNPQSGQQSLSQQVQQHQAHHGQQHSSEDGLQQFWYGYPPGHAHTAHHQSPPGPQQYLNPSDVINSWPHAHAHHYSHLQYQHHQAYQQQQQQQQLNGVGDWSSDEGNTTSAVGVTSDPSPPITISGSEISSPGTPATPPAINNNNNSVANNNTGSSPPIRPSQIRSPYEWMKKPSYQTQPNPGKTRTKDKYRVVYTDHQRLELEKEFHYSRYITIRRKAELAANLALSERQVKIWFQNRRAKERKQSKKREEQEQKDVKPTTEQLAGSMASLGFAGMSSMLGSLMQNGGTPPLGPHPHPLALGHPPTSLHPTHHAHHTHPVLGL